MKYIALIVAMLVLCVGSLYAVDMKGLVLYLPFNEGSGTVAKDASGNGNDGALQGKVDWVAGKFGKAVSIGDSDVKNVVLIKESKSLDVTDQITMSAWVNIQGFKDNWNAIIGKNNTYMLHTDIDADPTKKNARTDPLIWVAGAYGTWPSAAAAQIPLGSWHHILATYDGKQVLSYLDGVVGKPVAKTGKIDVTTADITVGRDKRAGCEARIFSLQVDDVMIFNRAVTAAEVKDLMGGNFTPVTPQTHAVTLWGQIKLQ